MRSNEKSDDEETSETRKKAEVVREKTEEWERRHAQIPWRWFRARKRALALMASKKLMTHACICTAKVKFCK